MNKSKNTQWDRNFLRELLAPFDLSVDDVPVVRLGDAFERLPGSPMTRSLMRELESEDGEVILYGGGSTVARTSREAIPNFNIHEQRALLVQSRGIINFIVCEPPFAFKNEMWAYTSENFDDVRYLRHHLANNLPMFRKIASTRGSLPQICLEHVDGFPVPWPPKEVRKAIADRLDLFTDLRRLLKTELSLRREEFELVRSWIFEELEKRARKGEVAIMPLGEALAHEHPQKYLVKSTDYRDCNPTPVLTPGSTFLLGMSDETEGLCEATPKEPVMLFDNFTTAFRLVSFPFKLKSSAAMILRPREGVHLPYVYFAMMGRIKDPIEHARQWISSTSRIPIPLPDIATQKRVADSLLPFHELVNDDKDTGILAELALREEEYRIARRKLLTFG